MSSRAEHQRRSHAGSVIDPIGMSGFAVFLAADAQEFLSAATQVCAEEMAIAEPGLAQPWNGTGRPVPWPAPIARPNSLVKAQLPFVDDNRGLPSESLDQPSRQMHAKPIRKQTTDAL